jgi:kynurenine formamidase
MALVDMSVSLSPAIGVPPALRNNRMQTDTIVRQSAQSQEMVRIGFIKNLCIHTGTHVDAPCHALTGTRDIGQISLERLVGDAVVLDLGEVTPNEAIDAERLQPFAGDVRADDIAVLYSHWSERRWNTEEYWSDSPYLTVEAARWLVSCRPKRI